MSVDKTRLASFEQLPTEIFLQIFAFLPLRELVAAFYGLNFYIDSSIRSVRVASHVVRNNDADAIQLLQLFPTQIGRLLALNAEMLDFTSLINLRSLILKYGTTAQFNSIRPQHFPMLEILHIYGKHQHSMIYNLKEINDLFQLILSNGFPRLRLCTAVGIAPLATSDTWSRSPALRSLHLDMKSAYNYEQIFYLCPNLRRFTSYGYAWIDPQIGIDYGSDRRIFNDLKMLEGWELQNKFILDVNPMELFSSNKPPPRFNKTTMIPRFHEKGTIVIQGRILPQTEPYCRASFLLEIKLPPGYPYKPSEIIFLDPIYHPNVDESGKNCSSWGYPDEKFIAATTLVKIIENIIRIIDSVPDYGHSDNHQCAREHQFDYQTFYAKALERTLSYGRPRY